MSVVVSWDYYRLRLTCETCGEVIAEYRRPKRMVDLIDLTGDAYSDHMHDEREDD